MDNLPGETTLPNSFFCHLSYAGWGGGGGFWHELICSARSKVFHLKVDSVSYTEYHFSTTQIKWYPFEGCNCSVYVSLLNEQLSESTHTQTSMLEFPTGNMTIPSREIYYTCLWFWDRRSSPDFPQAIHCKNICRFYGKITGNQLPVHFP